MRLPAAVLALSLSACTAGPEVTPARLWTTREFLTAHGQAYEGAMTLFGRWSFGALGTELRRVARQLREVEAHHELGELPARLPLEQWVVPATLREVRS